jgi:hypothetical protein
MSAVAGPRRCRASRPGRADVAFVQAIFLRHDENCFATYQARSTSGVTAGGPLARLRSDQVTMRSSATRQADTRPVAAGPHSSPVAGVITFPIPLAHQRGRQQPDWPAGIALGLGGLAGAYTGARFRSRLSRQLAPCTPGGVTEMNPISWHPERTPAGPAALSSPAETPRAPCWHSHRNCPRSGQRSRTPSASSPRR